MERITKEIFALDISPEIPQQVLDEYIEIMKKLMENWTCFMQPFKFNENFNIKIKKP